MRNFFLPHVCPSVRSRTVSWNPPPPSQTGSSGRALAVCTSRDSFGGEPYTQVRGHERRILDSKQSVGVLLLRPATNGNSASKDLAHTQRAVGSRAKIFQCRNYLSTKTATYLVPHRLDCDMERTQINHFPMAQWKSPLHMY